MRLPIVLATLIVTSGCFLQRTSALPKSSIPDAKGTVRTAFALRYIDMKVGTGAVLAPRQCVYAHYTGWLVNGTKFDSSRDTMPNGQPRTPLAFPLGVRRVIAGWDLGFEGMQIGGQRRLFIPYQLAYGEAGRPPVIPARAALIFDVELVAMADTLPRVPPPVPPVASTVAAPGDTVRRIAPPQPQCPAWAIVSGGG